MVGRELRELDGLRGLTPGDLERDHPEVFEAVRERMGVRLRTVLRDHFADAPEEVRELIDGFELDDPLDTRLDRDVTRAIRESDLDDDAKARAIDRLNRLELPETPRRMLHRATPIAANPLFARELAEARSQTIGAVSRLGVRKVEAIVERGVNLATLGEGDLGALVDDGTLDDDEANELGFGLSLYRLLDENPDLVEAIRDVEVEAVRGRRVRTVRDLVHVDHDGWVGLLEGAAAEPPVGLDRETHADLIERRVASLLPTDTMAARLRQPAPAVASVRAYERLAANGNTVSTPSDGLVLDGIAAAGRDQAREAHAEFVKLDRANPGLRLGEVIDDAAIAAADTVAVVQERLDANARFLEQNDRSELLHLDLSIGSDELDALDMNGISDDDRPLVLENLKAYQRMYSVAGNDAIDASSLIAAGYPSAVSIASVPFDAFVGTVGVAADPARAYHDRALTAAAHVGVSATAIYDAIAGGLQWTRVGNVGPDIGEYFADMQGFDELFGAQTYCDCEHCRSVLSPAAYFADLMRFVEEHILDEVFVGNNADHVLSLRHRRPDLWQLQLTCENTNTEIPLLVVITEILETYVAERAGFAGDLGDRAAVTAFIYGDTIATAVDSFAQPVVLAHEILDTYLGHWARRRGDLARFVASSDETREAIELGVPRRERDLIAQPNIDLDFLRAIYGTDEFALQGGVVRPFDSQILVRATKLDRDDLGRAVGTDYVTNIGAVDLELKGAKRSPQSVQHDIERAHGFTLAALDQLHRLVRLQRATAWTFEEIDAVDRAVRRAGRAANVTAALGDVVQIATLADRFSAPVDVVASTMGSISSVAHADRESLLDRSFNAPFWVERGGLWPDDASTFVHASHAVDPAGHTDTAAGRLASGLGLSDDQLISLVAHLADQLGADLDGATNADRSFALTDANLGLLYRHAIAAAWLDVTIDDLAALIRLHDGIVGPGLTSFDDLLAVVALAGAIDASSLELGALLVAAGRVKPDTDIGALADSVAEHVADGRDFTDDVFAGVDGLTAADSGAIVAANAARIVAGPNDGTHRLVNDFDPAVALAVPDGIVADNDALMAAVMRHNIATLFDDAIGEAFVVAHEIGPALVGLAGFELDDAATFAAAVGDGPVDPLLPGLRRLLRLDAATSIGELDAAVIGLLEDHLDLFGAATLDDLDAPAALRLAAIAQLGDEARTVAARVLPTFDPMAGFAAADSADLQLLTGLGSAAIVGLAEAIVPVPNAIDTLELLGEAAAIVGQLGITAETLADAASDDYDRLDAAASAIVAAMRVAHPDESEWREVAEPYEAEVLNAKRDGLVAYLVHSVHPEFETTVDLYRYFLLDPEVDGCFPTSRVVAAISSVQAYAHRVLMNLERSRDGELHVDPSLVPREEWEWRKHYRVWEANRKVFLWTENYLDPDVRDDKTLLFEEFESAVMQNELDEQSILDAYATYMEGFEVLANLSVAGSYHDIDDDSRTDVLHLIGVTPGDPPTYYYRTAENVLFGRHHDDRTTTWGPWAPVDVKIPVRECSPVVHNGRLHVFWVEIVTSPQNEVREAGSKFVGYRHRLAVKFSTLRLDGSWTVPQTVSLYGTRPFAETDGVIDDPLIEPEELDDFLDAVRDLFGFGIFSADPVSLTDALRAMLTPRYDDEPHTTSRDGYTLSTSEWTRVHPESTAEGVRITAAGYQLRAWVDLFDKHTREASGNIPLGRTTWSKNPTPPSPALCRKGSGLWYGTPSIATFDDYAWACLIADDTRLARVGKDWPQDMVDLTTDDLYKGKLANIGTAAVHPVNGSLVDAVIDDNGDLLLLQGSAVPGLAWAVQRVGTTLAGAVARTLFTDGIDGLLATEHQEALGEDPSPIQLTSGAVIDDVNEGELDFSGPFGVYYREIFFHIPFLVAKTLQAQRNHAEAKRWYEYLFDPTTAESIEDDPALSDEENDTRRRDRNWRYAEFRNLGLPELREILTDSQAIAAYRSDPFNPHTIARLRLSAYQKSVVMAYVDNLLDWGDQLFTRFQQESINEAINHYQTARDILGEKPVQIGDCGTAAGGRSYEDLKPPLEAGTDFLAELEHWTWLRPKWRPKTKFVLADAVAVASSTWLATMNEKLRSKGVKVFGTSHLGGTRAAVELVQNRNGTTTAYANVAGPRAVVANVDEPLVNRALIANANNGGAPRDDNRLRFDLPAVSSRFVPGTAVAGFAAANVADDLRADGPLVHTIDWRGRHRGFWGQKVSPRFVWSFMRQVSPAFCIPANTELLERWDRVDDRLYKIHNCLDIHGNRRQLSLFAPEIDPRALIRAFAAGLSIDEILDAIAGSVPPLRFPVLLDRARQYASSVQAFGSALQGALERKDAEELTQLRNTHQRNVLSQTTRVRLWEYDVAVRSLEAAQARHEVVSNRLGRLTALEDAGLNTEEWIQRTTQHIAGAAHLVEAGLGFLSGALHLIPQLGSPFAMKYGGMESGSSAHRFAVGTRAVADAAHAVVASAAMEATFSRRAESWRHQIEQAEDELAASEKDIAAAQLRVSIAERAVELHELAVEQAEEIDDATRKKFSNLGFYTWQVQTLQRVHRDAYNCALSMARMAERAYRFERDDHDGSLLGGDYWSASHAGLLSGSQLLVDLEQLDKRFLETTPSEFEVDQTFSLFQMDPAALINLKRTGEAVIDIPEHFFDLSYPGHYRRRIKTVRITIPCVAGPHTNVAATLTLEQSLVRATPDPGAALTPIVPVQNGGVATSTAQNDAGRFELAFNAPTYLPFEGAGAVSRWRLTMPSPQAFPPFDYATISDVLVRIAYTASADGVLAQHRELDDTAVAGTLAHSLAQGGLQRVISLRYEHARVFQRLVEAPVGTAVDLDIESRHFPWFVSGRELRTGRFRLVAVSGLAVGALRLTVDGHDTAAFGAAADVGGLPAAAVAPLVGADPRALHTLVVADGGDAAGADGAALDADRLDDLLVVVDYTPGARA